MKRWKMNVHEWTSSMMMLVMMLPMMLMMMLDMMIFMSFMIPYIIYLVKLNYNLYPIFFSPTSWSSHFCLVLSHILENKLHKFQKFIWLISNCEKNSWRIIPWAFAYNFILVIYKREEHNIFLFWECPNLILFVISQANKPIAKGNNYCVH